MGSKKSIFYQIIYKVEETPLINSGFIVQAVLALTLKAPNKNCSRRHFDFLILSFEENKA